MLLKGMVYAIFVEYPLAKKESELSGITVTVGLIYARHAKIIMDRQGLVKIQLK